MGRKDPLALVKSLVHSPTKKLQDALDGSLVVAKGVSGTSHSPVKIPRVTRKSPRPEPGQ